MAFGIGELARRTEVKVPTIRYYEQIGLLEEASRSDGKQRRYSDLAVKRLNFIRHARQLGFEVDDIRTLIELTAEPQESCHLADSITQKHLADVESKIKRLTALRNELRRMVREGHHGRVCECRILEVVADHSLCLTEHH